MIFRLPGERGKTGDHGQMGDPGQRGEVGNSGERGTTGSTGDVGDTGERGPVGPRGATGRARLSRMQLLVYLFIVAIIGVGFLKFEAADKKFEQQQDAICQKQIENRDAVRQVYRDVSMLGQSLLDAPDMTPKRRAVLAERFKTFERERLAEYPAILPGCVKP